MPPSAPHTPHPDMDYAVVKTPTESKLDSHLSEHGPSWWSSNLWFLGNVAQFLIYATIFVYVFGQFFYFSAGYADLSTTIGTWYGVAATTTGGGGGGGGGSKTAATGHREMVLPTYFFFFTVLPAVAAVLLFEFLRHYNVRQISSGMILKTALVLRRKPSAFGRVSSKSFGELLFLLALVGGNVYVFQYYYRARYERMSAKSGSLDFDGYLNVIALTFGFVCIFNLAFLFLPATRNSVWMEFLNISYANGVKYHKWIGVMTIGTALLHCIGYYWTWIRQSKWVEEALPCFDCDVGSEGKDPWMNFLGLIALIAFLAIGATSFSWVRRRMYNTFYFVHHMFVIGTIFAVLHWNPILMWILPTFVLYVISRSLSSSNGFTPVVVKEFTTLGDDVVKVTLGRSITRAGHFKVGQFVYLNVPAISKLQWHAFTIASSPRSSSDSLTILLKSLGDWTAELVEYTNTCKTNNVLPVVYMDAFYGASLEMYDEYSTVCLVGGGIGATPMFAILEDMVCKLASGAPMSQKVHFVFTFRELALLEELHPVLMQIKELDPQEQYFVLDFYLTRAPTNAQLDASIDHERLAGKPHVLATCYDTSVSKVAPVAFSEPLRSRTNKSLMYITAFFAICLVLTIVKYGAKVTGTHANLWPLQNFVEISLVFVVVALVVYVFMFVERRARVSQDYSSAYGTSAGGGVQTPTSGRPYSSDVHSFRDLMAEYAVKVGQRPDMQSIMSAVLHSHNHFKGMHPGAGNGVVGVFISGPDGLKKATERAITVLGASHFDQHEEQFEL